jgi:hypothetical protein
MIKQLTVISALLISLLLFSVALSISGNFVSASTAPVVFCPNTWKPPPSGPDTYNEIWLAQATCEYITSMLAGEYPSGCYYSYNEDCTYSHYQELVSWLQTYYDHSVVFSKGHRNIPSNDPLHISLMDHDGYDIMDDWYDNGLFDITSSENVFTFIWHCQTAQYYPQGATQDENGHYHGMPFCWTHNAGMGCYNDSGPQVFLGWVDDSPQFETQAEGTWNYAHVAYYFWYRVCQGDSVVQALNYIAQTVFGDANYLQSPLCDWLIIWGNRNLELP